MVAPTCFGITLPSSGNVSSAFLEMLNWGAVDRILWMGVLCLVTWCARAPRLYPQEIFLVLVSVRGWVNPKPYFGRKDYVNKKIPVIPSRIAPVSFRFVAQCLNQLRYRVSPHHLPGAASWQHARNIPSAVCVAPPEDEQVMLETCRGPWFLVNWIRNAPRWFQYTGFNRVSSQFRRNAFQL
jgi:hypothetical protein